MTDDDVLFGYRLALFDLAGRTSVSHACRSFGVHRSTYYRWKHKVDRHGLEMLRPRERRAPRMPNQLSQMIEQRIVAYSLGHPGSGPRGSRELARPKWGGIMVSPNGVWRVLRRHGLNTRTKRLALIAGYRAPYQPPASPLPNRTSTVERPGELVGIDCFFVGRLRGTKHPVWQVTAIDCYSSYAWADLVTCPTGQPTSSTTSHARSPRRRKTSPAPAGSSNASSPTTATSFGRLRPLAHTPRHPPHPHPPRPAPNQRPRRTPPQDHPRRMLATQLRPLPPHHATAASRRDLAEYLHIYNTDRAHNGRITNGRIPADIIDPAHKMRPQA